MAFHKPKLHMRKKASGRGKSRRLARARARELGAANLEAGGKWIDVTVKGGALVLKPRA